ncbi:hypothetical protein Btru_047754 [Bulinus truncatus]|nr:hypothetical protein Btru_047754 [Bulinus truncatus]
MRAKRSDSMYDILFKSRADHTYGGVKDPQAGAAGSEAKLKPPQALRTYPGFYAIAKPITQYLRAERKQRLKTTARDVLAGPSGLPDVQPRTSVTQERRSLPEATAPSGSARMMKLLEITRFPAMPSQITSNQITDGPGMTPLSIQASPDAAAGSANRPLTIQEIPDAAAGHAKKPLSIKEILPATTGHAKKPLSIKEILPATTGHAKKPLSIQEILPATTGPAKKPLSIQPIPGASVIPAHEQSSSSSSWAASSTQDRRPLVAPDLSVLQGGPLLASQDRTAVLPGIQPPQPRKQLVDPGMPSSRPAVPTIIIGWPPPLPTQPSPATASSLRENMAGIPGTPTSTSQKSSRYPASQLSERDRQRIHGSILKEQSSLPAILPSTSRSHEQAFPTPGKSEKPLSLSEGDFRFAGTPPTIKDLQMGQAPSSAPYATPIPLNIEPPSIDVQLADTEDGTATRPFLDESKAYEVTTTTTPIAPSVLTAEAPSLFPLHIDMQGPCVDFFNVTRPDLVSMKYAARHGVEELLQFMMYSIVIHRPQDPIDFLIDLMRSIRHTMSLRRESARLVQDAKNCMIRTAGLTVPPKDAAPASTTDIFGQL